MSINFGRKTMTHQEILNKTKAEIDSLCAQAKKKLDAVAPREAEVGKWYKDPNSQYLVHVTKVLGKHNYVEVYGFDCKGNWFDKWDTVVHQLCTEATHQEVEKALIEEAKRIGHTYSEYDYNPEENELCGINDGRLESVFCDGHWEQPDDKFAELKEAHKNGSKIQYEDSLGNWHDIEISKVWFKELNYRIKPEEKPKAGDVVKAWDSENGYYTIGVIKHIEDWGYFLNDGMYWDNAKTLTQQEAIELLFNNK